MVEIKEKKEKERWRPEGWTNLFDKDSIEDGMTSPFDLFELGADAIVEALRKQKDRESLIVWLFENKDK